MDGLSLFKLEVKGKTVLLKPNLVEFLPGKEATTHPALVGTAAEGILREDGHEFAENLYD